MAELGRVRGVLTQNITLSGLGQVSDGLTVGSTGATENWLVTGQTDATQNGDYTVDTAGVWTRRTPIASLLYGDWLRVREGNTLAGSRWMYVGPDAPGAAANLPFQLEAYGRPRLAGVGLEDNLPFMQLPARLVAGETDVGALSLVLTNEGVVTGLSAGYGQTVYIEGLSLSRFSIDQILVQPGAAWSQGNREVVERTQSGTASIGGASGFYYLYVRRDAQGGVSLVALPGSANAPAAPYSGYARSHPTQQINRYIGAALASSVLEFYRSVMEGDSSNPFVRYLEAVTSAPFRVLSGGTATAETSVSCAGVVPPTARTAWARVVNSTDRNVRIHDPGGSGLQVEVIASSSTAVNTDKGIRLPLDANQNFRYSLAAASGIGGGFTVDILGYWDRR